MMKKGEGEFKNLLFAFILFSLFGFLILSVINSAGTSYSKDMTEFGGTGALNLNKFNQSISGIESDAKDMQESFSKQNVWSAVAGVVVTGIFSTAWDMVTIILLPFDILNDLMVDILGVPQFVAGIILALLIFSIIFAIWSLIKVGN